MDIDEPWARIVAWLTTHAPASAAEVRPPAAPAASAAARARYDRPWPPDLIRLYELCDGTTGPGRYGADILPITPLAPLADMMSFRDVNLEVAVEFATAAEIAEHDAQPAGTMVFGWLPSFAPFATDGSGDGYFVDLRGGAGSGAVGTWRHADVSTGADWPSLTIMFDEVATALETGGRFDGWVPGLEDGRLQWEPAGN